MLYLIAENGLYVLVMSDYYEKKVSNVSFLEPFDRF